MERFLVNGDPLHRMRAACQFFGHPRASRGQVLGMLVRLVLSAQSSGMPVVEAEVRARPHVAQVPKPLGAGCLSVTSFVV